MVSSTYVCHLSAQEKETQENTWVFGAFAYANRPQGSAGAPEERKKAFNSIVRALLPKKYRLTSRGDFKDVFQGSLRARSGPFQLMCRKNSLSCSRFGFIVSLMVSKKAVQRNKLRRRLHEIMWHFLPFIVSGYDCIIRAHPGAIELKYGETERHINQMVKHIGILNKSSL